MAESYPYERLRKSIEVNTADIADIREEVAVLKARMSEHGALCPYREDIARARNNLARIAILEQDVRELMEGQAKAAVINGIITAVITALLTSGMMLLITRVLGG